MEDAIEDDGQDEGDEPEEARTIQLGEIRTRAAASPARASEKDASADAVSRGCSSSAVRSAITSSSAELAPKPK